MRWDAAGRFHEGAARHARIAQEHLRDLLAVQFVHVGCFSLGIQHELRDWPLRALRLLGAKQRAA